MSLWSGFKKKLEEGWAGADFWDKDENLAQRQTFAAARPAPVEQRVQPRQTTYFGQTAQPNDIVKELTQAPSFQGVSEEYVNKQEGPQQSLWDKFKDQVDPNSEADKFRRREAGDPEQYQAKGVGKVVKTVARPFTETADTIIQGGRYGVGAITGNDAARDSAGKQAQESWRQSLPGVIYKPAEDMAVNALYHYPRAVIEGGNIFDEGYTERYDNYLKRNNLTGNMIQDTVAPAAETAFNILSLGQASALGAGFKEGIKNAGLKTAVKQAVPGVTKTAGLNFAQGASTELYNADPTAKGALQKGSLGAAYGTVGDIALAGVPSYVKSKGGVNKIPRLLEGGSTKITPDGKTVMVGISDDLRSAPGITGQIERVNTKQIGMGSNAMGDIDPAIVQKYVDDIQAGRAIDPLVVSRENGNILLQDGKHRLAALQQLGVEDVPTITQNMTRVAQSTPVGIAPGKPYIKNGDPYDAQGNPITIGEFQQLTQDPRLTAFEKNPTGKSFNNDDILGTTPKLNNLGEMPDFRARAKSALTPTQELAKKYGVSEATITRMTKQYGDIKTQNMLARTSDASNIRDKDAFFVSEMRKNFGSPAVNIKRKESMIIDDNPKSSVPAKVPAMAEATDAPVVKVPTKDLGKSSLGSIAKEFYDSKKGNQKIRFGDLDRLGQKIARQIDDDFTAIGSDFRAVARKVETARREGVKNLDDVNLTPDENALWKKVQDEMDYARRRESMGKREIGEGDFKELYLPNQKPGQYTTDGLFEGFRAVKPGNEFRRKNKIALDDLDYSPEVVGQYITRYGDTKLYSQERLARALEKDNAGLDPNKLNLGAQKVINLQEQVNKIETKIGAFGLGTRKQMADGQFVDVADELRKIGQETLDHKIVEVDGAPRGLTNGEKINSVFIDEQPLGTRVGLNQHHDAAIFAAKQVADSAGNKQALTDMVRQRLTREYRMRPDEIESSIAAIERIPDSVPMEVVQARVQGIYQNNAKQQLMRELQYLDITNPKLRKEVSMLANQILREGSIESKVSAKAIKGILQAQNAVFRKLNVGTAINELGDLPSFLEVYGNSLKIKPNMNRLKEFGLTGDIDPAIAPYLDQVAKGASKVDVLKSINDKTNLYKFVEHYKAAVVIDSAADFYAKKGLKGDALTAKVLEDYRELALPRDAFTKTFLDNAPLYTQYMSWGAMNLRKEARLLTGKIDAGKLADKTQLERIARNAYTNLPAKTVFWLSSNALKGTAIMTAFGLTDFTGLTNQDYSGIAEEDKSLFDKVAHYTNASTTLSLINSLYQSYEKEQLAKSDKYKDANYNPYENSSLIGDAKNKYTPSFIKNVKNTNELREKGYSENQDGRIQYEEPDDLWNIAKSYLFGKAQTDKGREYSGNEDVFRRGIGEIDDMAKESIGIQEREYNRPLTEEYSEKYKAVDEGARTALLEGGRAYNSYLDNLKKTDKASYDNYIGAMDGNHVSPEYWKSIVGGDPARADLTTFNMMRDRKKQWSKDLGKPYDPIYDLTDDQARAVLQQKSSATGDDIALKNALYKEQWYKDYTDRVKKFYDEKTPTDSDYEQTQRVKDWYSLSDQYNDLRNPESEAIKQFPLIAQQKAVIAKYGFDSDQSKSWFSANGDAYQAEKDAYNATQLNLINKMRAIEGYPPMSAEAFEQVSEVVDTDSDSKKKGYGSGGGGGGSYAKAGDFGEVRGLNLPSAKISVSKVKIKPRNKSKYVKIQRNKKA